MRILAIDIETSPILCWAWGLWDQNIGLNQIVRPTEMLCFVAKWVGEPSAAEFHRGSKNGSKGKMVKRAWRLLDEADVILHFNGKSFDTKHLQREFLEAGLTPPSPFKQIDLLDTCKRQFRFPSNKLAYVSKQLGLAGKVEHEGFELWTKCMEGDEQAWSRMRAYNLQDVALLEDMYMVLRPWVVAHPSIAAEIGMNVCPKCGGSELEARGFAVLRTGRYRRFVCRGCGSWTRSTKRTDSTSVVEVAA